MASKSYFSLSLDALRILDGWAADCAERAKHHAPIGIRKLQDEIQPPTQTP